MRFHIRNPFTNHRKFHKTSRVPKKKHSHRRHFSFGGRGHYPLIKALKLPDSVPSVTLNTLAKYAKSKQNGAVQGVKSNTMKVPSYTVIVANEKALLNAGLTTKSPDFGELSAAVKQGLIESASMQSDLKEGKICLIPSNDTLANIGQYDSLRKIVYHWGLFLSTFKDSNTDNHVVVLASTVNFDQLEKINHHHPLLSTYDGNELVVGKDEVDAKKPHWSNKAGSDTNKPANFNSNKSEASQQSSGAVSAHDSRVARNHDGVDNSKKQTEPKNHGSNQQKPSSGPKPDLGGRSGLGQNMNQSRPQRKAPQKPQTPPTAEPNSASSNPKQLNQTSLGQRPNIPPLPGDDQTSSASQVPKQAPKSTVSSNNQPTSPNTNGAESEAKKGSNESSKAGNNQQAKIAELTKDDPGVANILKASGMVDSNSSASSQPSAKASQASASTAGSSSNSDVNQVRESLYNDPSQPQQSPQTYTNQLQNFKTKTYYDDELGFHINMSDFRYLLREDKPRLIKIKPVKSNDKLGKLLNAQAEQFNQRSIQLNYTHKKRIMDKASDMVSELQRSLQALYNPDDKNTVAGRKRVALDSEYAKNRANRSKFISSLETIATSNYSQRRASYASEIADHAKGAFDDMHHEELSRKKDALSAQVNDAVEQKHLNGIKELNQWRRTKAQASVQEEVKIIQKIVNKARDSYANDEDLFYNRGLRRLSQIRADHFDEESRRIQALNDAKQHDNKVSELRKSVQDTINNYTDKIKAIKAEDQRIAASKAQAERERAHTVESEKQQLQASIGQVKKQMQTEIDHSRKDVADEFRHRLAVQADQNKALNNERQQQKRNYEQKLADQRRERLEAKQQSEDRLNSLSQVIKNMRMDENPNSNQSKGSDDTWGKVAILAVVGALLAGGGYLVHGSVESRSGSPRTEQVSQSSANSKANQQASSSAQAQISSASASASSSASVASASMSARNKSHDRATSHADSNMMTQRPKNEHGKEIGTSVHHKPVNYIYMASGNYKPGSSVVGYENNHRIHLKVSKVAGHRVFVKDLNNQQSYAFNV